MKHYLLSVSFLLGLCACGDPEFTSLSTSAVEKVRFNALISCLGDTVSPADLIDDEAFEVVDYFGEVASLGHANLGKSQLEDPWCLLTVDVQGYPAEAAFSKLKNALDMQPDIMLRLLSREAKQHGQDRSRRYFDPGCEGVTGTEREAGAALSISVSDLRAQVGVEESQLKGQGMTVAMLDGGVQNSDFRSESEAAGFSRSFLGSDYPSADVERYAIEDGFDCEETPYKDAHGSLVSEIIRSVAPDANQVMFKVCDDEGYCPDSSIAKALLYLSNDYSGFPKIDVINMSFGGHLTEEDMILRALLERMTGMNHETLIVASIGNDADASNHYPADYYDLHKGMIPVAAAKKTSQAWQLAEFNPSAVIEHTQESMLAAPGVRLNLTQGNPRGVTGTSFAAPVVSAVAALERQHRPAYNTTAMSLHMNLLNQAETSGEFKFVHFQE